MEATITLYSDNETLKEQFLTVFCETHYTDKEAYRFGITGLSKLSSVEYRVGEVDNADTRPARSRSFITIKVPHDLNTLTSAYTTDVVYIHLPDVHSIKDAKHAISYVLNRN
jgi:hypothetical protein